MSQEPRVHVAPTRLDKTYGDLASDLAADYGLMPDPWQRIVLDDWLAVKGGKWASLTCGLAVPRQNGKNAVLEIRELFGMVGRGEKILHTAHEVKTARKAFKRLQYFFGVQVADPGAKYPELNALVVEVRNVNGQEAIYLRNGGSCEIVARSKNSGRGFTVDVLVMDEAQEMSEEDLEALMPTTSAAPKGDPQWIFTGTPPGPLANGEVFTRVRDEALAGASKRLAWHEWSARPEARHDDREEWMRVNPATVTGRLQMEVIEGELARFSDDGFGRERLGKWAVSGTGKSPISVAAWTARLDEESAVAPDTGVVFAAEIALDRRSAAIGVAGYRADGSAHVGLIDHRPGVDWVLPALLGYVERNELRQIQRGKTPSPGVVIDPTSPAGTLVEPLRQAGVDPVLLTTREVANACAGLQDAVTQGRVWHTGQPAVATALGGAIQRDLGDGGWAFGRKKSAAASVDITPLVVVTNALWGLNESFDIEVWGFFE